MKYYVIAGEASGDLHASNLIKEIKNLRPDSQFRCWGGDLMKSQGAELVKHYRELAFMGFTEVVLNLRTILKNIELCKKDILEYKPDALILVDYPGFNLRIAEFAKKHELKVIYYISPQVWAWKQSRVHKIKNIVDKMIVILPFEKDFYKKFDYDVDFVGHPLLDAIDEKKDAKLNISAEKPVIAILPGSRRQEIATMLPIMLNIWNEFKDYEFVIAGAPSVPEEFYKKYIDSKNVRIVYNQTYDLLKKATAALVTSGTATLETALFEVPEVVCYKGGKISYLIAKNLIKVKYIALANLIMEKEIIKELIQDDFNESNLKAELNKILNNENRIKIIEQYKILKNKLGGPGASHRAAELIVNS